jgi:hypothetical protein
MPMAAGTWAVDGSATEQRGGSRAGNGVVFTFLTVIAGLVGLRRKRAS